MHATLLSLTVAAGLLGLFFAVGALATRRLWTGRPYLSIAYGSSAVGLVSMIQFVATWLKPAAGGPTAIVLIIGALGYLIWARAWKYWRVALPLALLMAGIIAFYVGILSIWTVPAADFYLVLDHYFDIDSSPDNLIPFVFSQHIAAGQSTHMMISDWNGSDRPPLQAGFILLATLFAPLVGTGTDSAFGASVVIQVLWLPGLYAVLRALGVRRKAILLGILLAAAAGTTYFNTVYTWPKVFSAGLVFCAIALLIDAIRRPRHFVPDFIFAVVAFVFAVLAHGVAAFVVPLVVILGIVAYRRQPVRRAISTTAIAAAAGVILYAPWSIYQTFVDPPGDRLVKWHIAGVIPVTDHRSLLTSLVDSYSHLTLGQWLAGRWVNLETVFKLNPFLHVGDLFARRTAEMQTTSIALGIAFPLAALVTVWLVVKMLRKQKLTHSDRVFFFLVAAALVCIAFWCLVMFTPGDTIIQQGSQVWIFLLLVAPQVWIAQRFPRLSLVALAIQFAELLVVYIPTADHGHPPINPLGLVLGVVGLVIVVAGATTVRRRQARLVRRPVIETPS